MASVKFGGGIVGMAGKIAGNVYAKNRAGAYIRAWSKPVNPNSARQVAIRALAGQIGDAWQNTLDATQRAAWNQYASAINMVNRLGEVMQLSGFNHFYRTMAAMVNAALTPVEDAPETMSLAEQDPTLAVVATEDDNNLSISFDTALPWAKETGAALLIYAGKPKRSNVQFFNGPWKYAGKVAGVASTGAVSPAVIACPYELGVAQKEFIRARIVRADGRLSNFFRASVVTSTGV